ncbi:MAG: diazepam-binding inhibitor (GABA receptor modulating acyl-CoA-binding protein) [Kiritimatiellia bacterium]|jgi:diazepam-binding inhibitor (GABA receptor modulating acyl-CoA-binding protein)
MALKDDFDTAVTRSRTLTSRPSNADLLNMYALFKQASEGDVTGKKPGRFDLKGRAKYDAWTTKKGVSADDAMTQYVALVDRLHG